MFEPVILFVAIIVLPTILSIILLKSNEIATKSSSSHVGASYWGSYHGTVSNAPPHPAASFRLHEVIADPDGGPSQLQPASHAVAWHP